MFSKTNIILLFLAIIANLLNGHDIIDSLNFVYGCPTMSGKCSCDISFESGDYFVKVECNGINGDPNQFKNELKGLRGYAIDLLVISNTYLNHLPDSPFVETDGRTPITAITEVRIVNSILNGFGSANSLRNSFFDGLGYSMVVFTVDNCPYMQSPWQWQRLVNSLMAVTEPIEQPIKSTSLSPDIEATINATDNEIDTKTTFLSTDSSIFDSSSEFTEFSTNDFTEISTNDFTEDSTELRNSSDYSTVKLLNGFITKTTPKPIPPIMEPSSK